MTKKTKYHPFRFVAFLMAVLMLFGAMANSIDLHYCQGKVMSFSFFGKAKSCYQLADAASLKDCTHQTFLGNEKKDKYTHTLSNPPCCKSQVLKYALAECPTQELTSLSSEPLTQFIVAYALTITPSFSIIARESIPIVYKPPLIIRDIAILYESFLI
ncbi:MAG: hypothetical protein AB8G15_13710 [Saprospiraceae bacterium]